MDTTNTFYLSNATGSTTITSWDLTFQLGTGTGLIPVAGNWDNSSGDSVGVYDPTGGYFRLKNTNSAGSFDYEFRYGRVSSTWLPVVGNYDGHQYELYGYYWSLRSGHQQLLPKEQQ